jgi:hypothetical protein
MIHIFLVCVCLFTAGCVIPQIHRVDPLCGVPVRDPQTGEIHRPRLKTTLLDSETKREIKDAQVVLVLARGPAYLPDSSQGPPKRPKVVVDRFARLDKLSYTDKEIYVWPFFAIGTLYEGIDVFVYKRGYQPVAFKQTAPGKYPDAIDLIGCESDKSKEMIIAVVVEGIKKEEWKDYAREVLARHLE